MKIPLSYSFRNLWTRKLTTALTAGGMALVVFVFATVLMLEEGLRKTLVETGSHDNVVVIRRSSQTEVQSVIDRVQAAIIESQPQVALGAGGERLVSRETVVLVNLIKRDTDRPTNVLIRGVAPQGLTLRPQVRITAGRAFRPGSSEIVAGRSAAERFKGAGIGETLWFGLREWTVVGTFDAGNSGFDSEIWGDAVQLMQAFRRPVYSSVLFRLNDPESFEEVRAQLERDQRLTVEAKRE
ncbi:MAG: ABC transporter permease, partial [Burkholderiales bacterium]|nr:ABC transporter permease [Burkholderiales bacterium]